MFLYDYMSTKTDMERYTGYKYGFPVFISFCFESSYGLGERWGKKWLYMREKVTQQITSWIKRLMKGCSVKQQWGWFWSNFSYHTFLLYLSILQWAGFYITTRKMQLFLHFEFFFLLLKRDHVTNFKEKSMIRYYRKMTSDPWWSGLNQRGETAMNHPCPTQFL